MELYQLRSFITVAGENHLTRAAQKLNTSQPAVSAHIKALEEEFGFSLFVRTPKGMQLTPGGQALCTKAEIFRSRCPLPIEPGITIPPGSGPCKKPWLRSGNQSNSPPSWYRRISSNLFLFLV